MQQFIRRHWQPKPIKPPKVNPNTGHLSGVQRSAEVIRHSLLSFEWWISPNGALREWFKINSKITSFLIIPAVIVMPLVTLILWQIAQWIGFMVSICGNLILLPLAGLVIAGLLFVIRILVGK